MTWEELQPNDWPNRETLQDAVDKGYFLTTGTAIPTEKPNEFVTKEEALEWVQLDTSIIPTKVQNSWWLPVKYYKGVFPVVVTEFTGLASPLHMAYNSDKQTIYYTDYDDGTYGIYEINPKTDQNKDDFTGIPNSFGSGSGGQSVPFDSFAWSGIAYYDGYIYAHGYFTQGMKVINCSTNTIQQTIAYTTGTDYDTGNVYVIGDKIWGLVFFDRSIKIIDPATKTLEQTLDTTDIPNLPGAYQNFNVLYNSTADTIWIIQYSLTTSSYSLITVYPNKEDLNLSIDALHQMQVGTMSDILNVFYYDATYNKIYVCGRNEHKLYVYDGTSYSQVGTLDIPMQGKSLFFTQMVFRETSGNLYLSGRLANNTTENGIYITYEIDRQNYTIINTLEGTTYGDMVMAEVNKDGYTNLNYTCEYNTLYRSVPNTGYETDGIIKGLN